MASGFPGTDSTNLQSCLRIGDTVLFSIRFRKKSGYVYSELSSSPYNFITVFPVDSGSETNPNFPNIAFATFKVLTANKYQKRQELRNLEEKQRRIINQDTVTIDFPISHIRTFEDHLLPYARMAAEEEIIENELDQKKKLGTKVLYGDLIQLQHSATNKYVTVRSEASKTENNNLLVNLSNENSEGVIFRILPKYKVRSVGEEIHYGDQMKLESMKTQGQFLHSSASHRTLNSVGILINSHHNELNLSASETALTLLPHYSPYNSNPLKTLRAGNCVRLFHREDECYIVAEGSFAQPGSVTEKVHCRQRRVDQRKHSHPSTSANTYWQIEKEDARNGEVLSWGERCRIRHLPTRLYLAVCMTNDETWQVTLKDRSFDDSDLDTLFNFHPLIEEGIEVLLESYARIQHLVSQHWLHLEKKENYKRANFDPNAEGLEGLQWDSAELYKISTSADKVDYDAFTLQEVSPELVQNFNYVAGIVPVLSSHIEQIHNLDGQIVQKYAHTVRDSLREFSKWLVTDNERETKNRQKLLRNLRVLEQLAEILKTSEPHISSLHHVDICKECYNMLKKYLEGDSRKNENYLARFIEFFQKQVRKGLDAEEVLVEIVQDNLSIVSRMAQTRMGVMIEQFEKTKDSRFLHFLSSLCVCSGRPIPSTQNRLLKELVLKHGKTLFIRTAVQETRNGKEVICYRLGNSPPISINRMKLPCAKGKKTLFELSVENPDKSDCELLEAQLHLFGRLCKGNNKTCIDRLTYPNSQDGMISFEEALLCAGDDTLNTTLRSRYVELILVMFVDVGENRPFLDNLCYSFIYSDLEAHPYATTGKSETVALTGVENIHFPQLKIWLQKAIYAKDSDLLINPLYCDESHIEENELLAQVIDVLGHLVRYGYYDNEKDINEVVVPLIDLLNGKTDLPSEHAQSPPSEIDYFLEKGRKEDSPVNRPVFTVKNKILEVLDLILKFEFYVKLQKFIFDFKLVEGTGRKQIGTGAGLYSPPKVLKQLNEHIDPELSQEFLYSKSMISAVRDRLKLLCDDDEKGCGLAPKDYCGTNLQQVLLDLSCYDCEELVSSSLHLLTQMYYFYEELFSKAQQAQLLVYDLSIEDYIIVNQLLPQLRQLLRVDPDHETQDQLISILNQLCSLCVFSNHSDEPNVQNQIMMDNFGVVSDILSYVFSKGLAGLGMQAMPGVPEVTVREEVFQTCFHLLKNLTIDNKRVQQHLFNRIDDLLQVKVPVSTLADLADLLTEVFTGGPDFILKVTECHVERIFEIIVTCQNATVQAQFMITLQAMAKIEKLNLPVRRNQGLIVKNFCRLRDKFCQDELGEGRSCEEGRMRILKEPEVEPPDAQLQLLLSVTDMLAACAEGENHFIESVCQNIFSIEELINIMSNRHLPAMRKRPFVRFLIWAYMNTDGDSETNRETTLTHGLVIWNYLEHLAKLLRRIAEVLQVVSHDKDKLISTLRLSIRRRCYSTVLERPRIRTHSMRIPDVTGEDGQIKPGILEYLMDGIIPLLHAYYSSFFNPFDTPIESQRINEFDVSAQIFKSLLLLKDEMVKFFSSELQIEMFQNTIQCLCQHHEIRERAGITDMNMEGIQDMTLQIPERLYVKQYEAQQQLNDEFHQFSSNYHLSYMGPNTAKHQIDSPVDELEYSDYGEKLPLGPSFQQLVALYYNDDGDEHSIVREETQYLLKQLQISIGSTDQLNETEQEKQDKLDIRCLQVLRALIHNQIKMIDPELKERKPAKYREKSKQLYVPVQNCIQSFQGNAIQKVIPLLSHPNEAITQEALALMKALLFSGNEEVQRGIELNVRETREETLFLNLKKILENASLNYKEMRRLLLQLDIKQDRLSDSVRQIYKSMSELHLASLQVHTKVETDDDHTVAATGKEILISMERLDKTDSLQRYPLKHQRTVEDETESLHEAGTPLERQGKHSSLSELLDNDTSWTSLVLEVVGLMCDGQHRVLQDYLREQLDNFKTVNVVAEVASFLHTYADELTPYNLSQVHKILQALIEMCVGNVNNLLVIFDKLVIEPINSILKLPLFDKHKNCTIGKKLCHQCHHILDLINVKGSAVELLDAMLEETSSQTHFIAQGIGISLDIDALLRTVDMFYRVQSHPLVKQEEMDDDCQRGMLRGYHVLTSLKNFGAISFKSQDILEKHAETLECKESFNKCHEKSLAIEIHYKDSNERHSLARVRFPYDPDYKLREEVTEVVRWNINRDSMEDKQRALLDLMPALKSDIKHQMKLKKRKLSPIISLHALRHRLLLLLTVILNVFILFLYEVPENSSSSPILPAIPKWFQYYLLQILGSVHIVLSLWVVIEYFLINWPHFKLPGYYYKARAYLHEKLSKYREETPLFVNRSNCLDVNIFGVTTLYMIVFLACSALSLVFRGYFYCICLLFIIANNDILQRVLRAVTKNGASLMWVAVLGFIILYIYAVISFAFLHNRFTATNETALYCDTLGQCMYSIVRYGLLDNLGLLVPLKNAGSSPPFSASLHIARLLFDLSFFIVVITIGLNVVFGIIVDTFSELREERSDVEIDQKSTCFICDLPNHEFERKGTGFRHHVKYEHNMWEYVYYSLYLDSIDTGDHNAIQKYVYELIENRDTRFFPQEEATCLAGDEDATETLINELISKIDYILQHFKDKEQAKSVIAKKEEQRKWEREVLRTRQDSQLKSLSFSMESSQPFDK